MGRLDIGVGDDFPVDEPPPPSPEAQEAIRSTREEWEREKAEWKRRKREWRAHRDAFRKDMRARRDAFKADVRKSIRENFGGYRVHMGFMPRLLIALAALALVIALLPLLFMFGFLVLSAALFFFALVRSKGRDYRPPTASQ